MKSIIEKYLQGNASEDEMRTLLEWLRMKGTRIDFNKFKLDWKNSLDQNKFSDESRESWSRLLEQITVKNNRQTKQLYLFYSYFRFAAVFFFLLSVGLSVYLTLSLKKNEPDAYTHIFADYGQISKVQLPDSSIIWLNSGSEITYNNHFGSKNRDLRLTGEAYFQAAKNSELPMIVQCSELQIKVIGTQFNVTAYQNTGYVDVVLENGIVNLLTPEIKNWDYAINPGEKARYTLSDKELKVIKVKTEKFTSWKDGIINIYNQSLEEILIKLEQRYNQKFEYDPSLKNLHYTFTIKNESLADIIKLMEKITPVLAVQENDVIIFKIDNKKLRKAGV